MCIFRVFVSRRKTNKCAMTRYFTVFYTIDDTVITDENDKDINMKGL